MYPERGELEMFFFFLERKKKKRHINYQNFHAENRYHLTLLDRQVGVFICIILPRMDADSYTFNYAYNKDR